MYFPDTNDITLCGCASPWPFTPYMTCLLLKKTWPTVVKNRQRLCFLRCVYENLFVKTHRCYETEEECKVFARDSIDIYISLSLDLIIQPFFLMSANHKISGFLCCGISLLCYLQIPFSKHSVLYQDMTLTVLLYFIKKVCHACYFSL